MPLYAWLDKKTEKTVEILRPFSEFDHSPTLTEAIEDGMTEEEFNEADWEKQMGAATIIRAPGFGSKGNWVLLFLTWFTYNW